MVRNSESFAKFVFIFLHLTRYDTDTIFREREFFRREFFSAEAEKNNSCMPTRYNFKGKKQPGPL